MENYYSDDEEEFDFYKMNDEIQFNIDRLWNDVITPYLEEDGNILNLTKDDIGKFISFLYDNSKYYKFVTKNLS